MTKPIMFSLCLLAAALAGCAESGKTTTPTTEEPAMSKPTPAPESTPAAQSAEPTPAPVAAAPPRVELLTSQGRIVLELDGQAAPATTANFLRYVEAGHYDGTIFHRVIPGFMVQGGGFTPDLRQKPTNPPIRNEAANGRKNARGTVAMARTNNPDSATAQFFINVTANDSLNYRPGNPGYAVFATVVEGMEVADAIVAVPTATKGPFENVPVTPVLIETARRLP
jgi:peptidyl-prolyl cis-trans isomerase A (cyclophilin A)